MSNLIAEHAYITAGIQRDRMQGRRTPAHILQRHHALETRARASMTPHELHQAMAASTSMQAQYLQQADFQAAHRDANNKGYYTQQLAKDLTGMTPDQLELAKRGQAIPVKGRGQKVDGYKQNLRNMLKAEGLGDVPYDRFLKVADRVEEIKAAGKSPASYLKQAFGQKAAAAESLIGAFHISGIGIEAGLSTPEADHYEQVTPELQRRTELADAWARKAMQNPEDREAITTRIDPTYLEDTDTGRGDLARAFAKHEAEQDAEDRANYSAPSYDIDESQEVDRYATL